MTLQQAATVDGVLFIESGDIMRPQALLLRILDSRQVRHAQVILKLRLFHLRGELISRFQCRGVKYA